MSKVDGSFKFSPISVNFLTEATKVLFAIVMLLFQVCSGLDAFTYKFITVFCDWYILIYCRGLNFLLLSPSIFTYYINGWQTICPGSMKGIGQHIGTFSIGILIPLGVQLVQDIPRSMMVEWKHLNVEGLLFKL